MWGMNELEQSDIQSAMCCQWTETGHVKQSRVIMEDNVESDCGQEAVILVHNTRQLECL